MDNMCYKKRTNTPGWAQNPTHFRVRSILKPQIYHSPTSVAVIAKTMKRAQKIAKENWKEELCVTYDLAIAKIVLQPQEWKATKFDNVFVALGCFHIDGSICSFLKKHCQVWGCWHSKRMLHWKRIPEINYFWERV